MAKKVLDRKASDNEYLHKDFHGALCYAIKYLDDNFGVDAVREYLQQVGQTYFALLTQQLKKEGLTALEKHWQKIFSQEQGDYSIQYEDKTLVLAVSQCPAVYHMKKHGYFYTDRFCLTTVAVNETVCEGAGYKCSCDYKQGEGKCIQRFWKDKEGE